VKFSRLCVKVKALKGGLHTPELRCAAGFGGGALGRELPENLDLA
jgi:hypothetical protein